ncbi:MULTISPECIES: protease modulator HflK [Pseudomonas syringae group]|uniref:protease modulator HflK n=1 Tax=Pseudomonas syringae group TaxID=136849 RepID=UPI0001AF543C|nr:MULTISPECIES: protease modulator HflK [Pseudomonas syringae group]KPB55641.1 Band 7 protein [Pseudomonas coronafaciens pv. oryzae]MCF5805829.1 protease modulator HflK [Pseudomonas tremae]MCF5808233.1 protease modulator HflK [Pseudomonas tremae]MCQ3017437.1 protease modulator HflK [Pseudomonas tremae]QGL59360.1 protease modulator HflK [Pseudomonas coronafaciens pv. oryzae str. 1_6]
MRVDLDEHAGLEGLPRFQMAMQQVKRFGRLMYLTGGAGAFGLLLAFSIDLFSPGSLWMAVLGNVSAALLLLTAGLQSAKHVALWRARALGAFDAGVLSETPVTLDESGWYERLLTRLSDSGESLIRHIGASTLWLAGWAVLALIVIRTFWNLVLLGTDLSATSSLAGSVMLLLAFGLLVIERQLSSEPDGQAPEAGPLAQLVRMTIAVMLIGALCLFFSSADRVWPVRLAVLIGLLPMGVAFEFLLRAGLSVFSPRNPRVEPRLLASSFIADLLRWPPRPLMALQHELHNRFGIDLRQIWAFTYMRRAFMPVLAAVAALGWALSGVHEIPMQGRGIYERFGKPVEVFGPGLHAGLPWPFGRVLAVENGVIHELATSVSAADAAEQILDPAEGPPPNSANRLWDASHINEKSQVIASSTGDKQSFQIVNMDVRFVYRIGLTDSAAMASTYNSADIPALIRSTASRVLVHDFASRTLDELLGEQRSGLADDIGKAVQADLKRLDSGVELLATVVEAIHPPAGAANAYHAVQAAQIGAQALIARERGAASDKANQAQLNASVARDQATGAAREVMATAQGADLRFSAERQAYAKAGQAFLLEQYLAQLTEGLGNAKLLILDHRLGGDNAPTIDLRSFTPPADPTAPRKAVQ